MVSWRYLPNAVDQLRHIGFLFFGKWLAILLLMAWMHEVTCKKAAR